MKAAEKGLNLNDLKRLWPEKFASEEKIFDHIHPGYRIFIGTACGEPQYLVRALIDYIERKPTAFFDAELLQVWTLGIVPYTDEKFKDNFRMNSFSLAIASEAPSTEQLPTILQYFCRLSLISFAGRSYP